MRLCAKRENVIFNATFPAYVVTARGMFFFFAALRYLKKKLKGNAESKDRDLLNFLRRYGDG